MCGLDPGITAITFVALGTSMPDLFASKVRVGVRVRVRVRVVVGVRVGVGVWARR